jgi:nucleotide-binding universal stress UspA family protein
MPILAQAVRSRELLVMQDMVMTTAQAEIKLTPSAQTLHLNTMLVAVDFSDPSKHAFEHAVKFARQFGAELTLLHVLEQCTTPSFPDLPNVPGYSPQELAVAEGNLRDLVSSARTAGVQKSTWLLRVGLATHEIVEAAKELDVDLIVIATHSHGGGKHFCLGSTAERVVRAAPCPVFVVREKQSVRKVKP